MAAKKINKLTAEQEALIPVVRDDFLRHGLSTDPADFDAAERALKEAYAVAGLPAPKIFIRLASPYEGAIAAAILTNSLLGPNVRAQVRDQVGAQVWAQVWDQVWDQVRDQVGDQVRDQVWDQVGAQVRAQVWAQVWDQVRDQVGAQVRAQVWAQVWDQVWDQVRDQVGAQVWAQVGDQVRDQVWDQVGAQVWAQVGDQVWAQVWDQVGAQVGDQVRDQVWDQVGAAMYGQHDASWLAFYDFFARAGLVEETKRLAPLTVVARSCGWVWMFAGAVVMTDRPRRVAFDAERRLHCETGKAVEYSDGFGVSAWHGTRVPDEWLHDRKSLTAKTALTWPNIEQRRAACEILGWGAILAELDARTIDKDGDPEIGELIEVDLPDVGRERFLRVLCGTGREFALPVPPDMKTALQAQAWTWGLDADSFTRPEVRT